MVLAFRWPLAAVAASVLACSSSSAPTTDGGKDGTFYDAPIDAGHERDARVRHDGSVDGGVPVILELSVTGAAPPDGGPSITLVPAFSPEVHDYYVTCADGTNMLTVSLTTSPGSLGVISQPFAFPAAQKQTHLMGVTEGQAVVAAAIDGIANVQYWVRCLPHDFPKMKMVRHDEAGTPPPGYYLLGTLTPLAGQQSYAMILDGNGVPVWYAPGVPNEPVYDVDLVAPDGGISFGYPLQIQQLNPFSTAFVSYLGVPPDPHEFQVLPNGDSLVIWSLVENGWNLTGLSLPLPDGGSTAFGPNSSILPCYILELSPTGSVVWQWRATDHFDVLKDLSLPQPPLSGGIDGGLVADLIHCNSIAADPLGNLLVSARQMNSIFYVERPSGRVLWKMGGAGASIDSALYVPVDSPFQGQHDARFLPNWKSTCTGASGDISLYDDQTSADASSRAAIYHVDLVFPGPDGGAPEGGAADCGATDAMAPGARLTWAYDGDGSVSGTGSFRISSDGSRVIGWGNDTSIAFTEVDEAKRDLLDFYFTDGDTTYRAIKVPTAAFNLGVLREFAGQ